MANFINKYLNQSAYDADSTKQYPNTSLVGTDIVFAMTAPTPVFGGLTVKYNIVDTTNEVPLFSGGGGSSTSSSTSGSGSGSGGGGALPTTMIVDGVEETPINTWRFETAGEHIVQYEFADNIINVAFNNINEITEIVIGDDITAIVANGAFANCSSLTSVTIGDSVTSIGYAAFQGCSGLTSVTIPDSVTSIGYGAFQGCSGLTSVTIPDSVTSISGAAFYSCTGLTSVTIPDSVTSIDISAFQNCTGLTSVTIGNSVANIGESAFRYCSDLTSMTVEATTPPTLGSNVFLGGNANLVIYVPAASVNTYKGASVWSNYALQIQAIQ